MGGPPTEVELAEKLEVSRTTLMDALKRLGLGWPPE
jgi:DNA-binding FadR family transcriptional regulator